MVTDIFQVIYKETLIMEKKLKNIQTLEQHKDKNLNIHDVSGSIFLSANEAAVLKKIRDYFAENDKTAFEHFAYSFLNNMLGRLKNYR